MIFSKKEKPSINFVSRIDGLQNIDTVSPVPAHKFKPDWWRKAPFFLNENERWVPDNGTIRQCPAFSDLFSSGYILPMWADTVLYYNSKTGESRCKIGRGGLPIQADVIEHKVFKPDMFTDHTEYNFLGSKAVCVWQLSNPWDILTSEGYDVFQMPLFYHYNNKWAVLPGTYDGFNVQTDKLELAFFADDEEVFIKQGTPLVQYIPYKRANLDANIRYANDKDNKILRQKSINRQTSFKSWYSQNRNK